MEANRRLNSNRKGFAGEFLVRGIYNLLFHFHSVENIFSQTPEGIARAETGTPSIFQIYCILSIRVCEISMSIIPAVVGTCTL